MVCIVCVCGCLYVCLVRCSCVCKSNHSLAYLLLQPYARSHSPTFLYDHAFYTCMYRPLRDTILLVVLLHPIVSSYTLNVFRCRRVGSKMYLVSDFTLECFDDTWHLMLLPSVLFLVLFSLGTPLFFFFVLWRRRHRGELGAASSRKFLGMLYLTYKPERYYFVCI